MAYKIKNSTKAKRFMKSFSYTHLALYQEDITCFLLKAHLVHAQIILHYWL